MADESDETLAWVGLDTTGSLRSGTRRPTVSVDVSNSITRAWDVEVDDAQ